MAGQLQVISETTILYGVLIRIGGYARPRAYMQFLDGRKLSCSIHSRGLAIAMAARLYQSIGVRGIASWDERDHTLLNFHIEELLPERDAPRQDALKGLADLVGKYYDHISDGETE
ncbi:MAG: hypothetical protein ABI835_04045 [Chloroflexota bacterium]